MDEYLVDLELEKTDYVNMIKLLTHKEKFDTVKDTFGDRVNTKVLLSSFLIRNFGKNYFGIDESQPLYQTASHVALSLRFGGVIVEEEYTAFFDAFKEWRAIDIREMRREIAEATENLRQMVVDEPRDDAEEQWNQGVTINLKVMNTTDNLLIKYGESPPTIK